MAESVIKKDYLIKEFTATKSNVPAGETSYITVPITIPDGYEIGAVTVNGSYSVTQCVYGGMASADSVYVFYHNFSSSAYTIMSTVKILFVK